MRIRISKRDIFLASVAGWACSYYIWYPEIQTARKRNTLDHVEDIPNEFDSHGNSLKSEAKTPTFVARLKTVLFGGS